MGSSSRGFVSDRPSGGGSVSPMVMNPTGIEKKSDTVSDFATFVTLPGTGKGHQIQIEPTEEEDVQIPGEKGTRRVPKPGTSVKIRFAEGVYTTADPGIIELLLSDPKGKYGFGIAYDINRHDPTGYWRKTGQFKIVTHEVVEVVGGVIGQGALTLARQNERVA